MSHVCLHDVVCLGAAGYLGRGEGTSTDVKIFTFMIHLPWLPPSCGTIVKNHHIAQLTDYISQSERYFLRERPAAQIKPSQSTSNSLEIKGERDCPLLLMSRSRLAMKQNECRVVMIETA